MKLWTLSSWFDSVIRIATQPQVLWKLGKAYLPHNAHYEWHSIRKQLRHTCLGELPAITIHQRLTRYIFKKYKETCFGSPAVTHSGRYTAHILTLSMASNALNRRSKTGLRRRHLHTHASKRPHTWDIQWSLHLKIVEGGYAMLLDWDIPSLKAGIRDAPQLIVSSVDCDLIFARTGWQTNPTIYVMQHILLVVRQDIRGLWGYPPHHLTYLQGDKVRMADGGRLGDDVPRWFIYPRWINGERYVDEWKLAEINKTRHMARRIILHFNCVYYTRRRNHAGQLQL
jgi:hypothetical protein